MSTKNQLSVEEDFLFHSLQIEINQLKKQIHQTQLEIDEFEDFLRSELEDDIIEVQELTILYKKIQKAKKEKRLSQKKKGKNYKEPSVLPSVSKTLTVEEKQIHQSKKSLYRQAMLYVHPDRFSKNQEEELLATEITTQLIQIYKEGSLAELEQIHAEITSQKDLSKITISSAVQVATIISLQEQKQRLQEELGQLQKRYTYVVLTSYSNPKEYLTELQEYYADRLLKLRKRTRKATVL